MKIDHQPIDNEEPPHIFPPENLNENIIFSKKVEIVGQEQIKEMWILYSRKGAKIDLYYQLHLPIHANKVILIINQEDDWTEFRNIDQVINQIELDQSGKEFNYRIFNKNFPYSTVKTPKSNLINILELFKSIANANQALPTLIVDGETSTNFDKFIEMIIELLTNFGIKSFNDNQDESNKLLSQFSPQNPIGLTQAIANEPDEKYASPQAIEVAFYPFDLHNNSINPSSAIIIEACEENLKTSMDSDGSSQFISDSETDSDEETQDMFTRVSTKTFKYNHLGNIDYSNKQYCIFNSKLSSNEVTKISKLFSDNRDKNDIKKNVQEAIKSSIRKFNKNDHVDSVTKLKSYEYLLIAIYSQGVNKNEQYKNFLELVNNGLNRQEQLTYSEAKKLSLIFQNICSDEDVFTGRIHSDRNSRLVGMRTKRIPLELLLETAKQDLEDGDFDRLQKFNKKIKSNFEKGIPNQFSSRRGPKEKVESPSLNPIASLTSLNALSQPPSPIAFTHSSHASPPPRRSLPQKSFASSSPFELQSPPSENSQLTPSRSRSQSESPRKSLEAQSASIKSQSQFPARSRSLSPKGYREKENITSNRAVTPTIYLDTPEKPCQTNRLKILPFGQKFNELKSSQVARDII